MEPPAWNGPIILWQSFCRTQDKNVFSLPELVDKYAEDLRRRFVAFVYQIGETSVKGKRIIDHLELRTGLSYWWMTGIAQKDTYANSPLIYDVIKLFVFEDLAGSYNSRSPVRLCSPRQELSLVLRAWCQDEGRHFEWSRPDREVTVTSFLHTALRNLKNGLPSIVRALLTFFKLVSVRLSLIGTGQPTTRSSRSGITLVDAFTHLHADSFSTGIFGSSYWPKLDTLLNDLNVPINWLHWYYEYPAVPSLRVATSFASKFNRASANQCHQIVDSRISLRLAVKIVVDFIRLNRAELSMEGVEQVFRPENSRLNFWELLKSDWSNSFRGPKAVVSLFHLNILEQQIRNAPHQKLGIYIQENQPWELALIQLWRTYGHGLLVGVAHTAVPFWDLRYVFDPRVFQIKNNGLPIPDVVALNGPDAISKFEKSGYPTDRYREMEALRYLYLGNLRRDIAHKASTRGTLRLLILGDILPEYTNTQISFLERCPEIPGIKLELVFKPHPASKLYYNKIRLPGLRISTRHILEELAECDVVFVGSATSAAVDAYQTGTPVISAVDGTRLNFSPLYRNPHVEFVNSPEDLARALSNVDINHKRQHGPFFTIDETIPRWKKLVCDALYSNGLQE